MLVLSLKIPHYRSYPQQYMYTRTNIHTERETDLDIVEVDLNQVRVVPLYSQQGLFYVSGVGLFIRDWFILGALDHTYNTFIQHTEEQQETDYFKEMFLLKLIHHSWSFA